MKFLKFLLFSFITIAFISLTFFNCGGNKKDESEAFDSIINENKIADIPVEVLNKVLKSLPSPVEMTTMIKQSGSDFQEKNINSKDNYKNYTTSYKKALNLGVYGTDIGYIHIYDRFLMSVAILDVIRILAADLNVGQFFDYKTIERMIANKSNIDSLMHITTVSFEKMTTHLKDQNRSHISALILTGGWLEGLYIFTQTYKNFPNKDLAARICEQKIAVNDLLIMLSLYEKDAQFKELIKDFRRLKEAYDKIEITYTVEEPIVNIVDGILVIEEQTKSNVKYTEDDLKEIIKITAEIRNKIIK